MRNNRLLFVFVLTVALMSCAKEERNDSSGASQDKVFIAETPDSEATKTYIDQSLDILWTSGDCISLFRSPVNEQYRFCGQTGDDRGEFRKNDSSEPGPAFSNNYAIYPYGPSSTESEGLFSVDVPAVQTYTADGFGPGANLMAAVTENYETNNFKFYNACAYLMLNIYGGDSISSIKLRGNKSEKIAGAASLSIGAGESIALAMSDDATGEISLDCGSTGVATGLTAEEAVQFWIVVPPITFTKGFTVDITNSFGQVKTITTTKEKIFTRNQIKPMAAVVMDEGSQNNILSFSLSDGTVSYNAFSIEDDYINVQVPECSNLSAMTASFTHSGASVKVDGDVQESPTSSMDYSDFVNTTKFVVTSSYGHEHTYEVRIFNLPIIFVETEGRQEIVSKTIDYSCSFVIQNTDGSRTDYGETTISGRGNTSWSKQDKKPYTVKFSKKQEVFGYPKHKRWHLLTCYGNSMSFFRDDIQFEAARRSAAHGWAPHGYFVDLFVNGRYRGLYWLCEKISVDKNRVNITEIEPTDITEPNLTGGYLMEYATGDELNFTTDMYALKYFIKNPDEDVQDVQFNYIKDYVNDLENSLADDSRFASRDYENIIDVDSWIDYWFMQELANGTDINLSPWRGLSCFCYKDRGGKLKAGPVWDMHTSSKNSFHADTSLYYKRLFQDPKFVQRIHEKWYGTSSEEGLYDRLDGITDRIDSIAPLIRQSGNRDLHMWDKTGSIESQASSMKSTINHNIEWLNTHIRTDKPVIYDNRSGGNEDFGDQDDQSGNFNFGTN